MGLKLRIDIMRVIGNCADVPAQHTLTCNIESDSTGWGYKNCLELLKVEMQMNSNVGKKWLLKYSRTPIKRPPSGNWQLAA